jgi:hypothetical protein
MQKNCKSFYNIWTQHMGTQDMTKQLFLLQMTGGPGNQRALDCGSGIGRITKHLLQRHFIKIDLV